MAEPQALPKALLPLEQYETFAQLLRDVMRDRGFRTPDALSNAMGPADYVEPRTIRNWLNGKRVGTTKVSEDNVVRLARFLNVPADAALAARWEMLVSRAQERTHADDDPKDEDEQERSKAPSPSVQWIAAAAALSLIVGILATFLGQRLNLVPTIGSSPSGARLLHVSDLGITEAEWDSDPIGTLVKGLTDRDAWPVVERATGNDPLALALRCFRNVSGYETLGEAPEHAYYQCEQAATAGNARAKQLLNERDAAFADFRERFRRAIAIFDTYDYKAAIPMMEQLYREVTNRPCTTDKDVIASSLASMYYFGINAPRDRARALELYSRIYADRCFKAERQRQIEARLSNMLNEVGLDAIDPTLYGSFGNPNSNVRIVAFTPSELNCGENCLEQHRDFISRVQQLIEVHGGAALITIVPIWNGSPEESFSFGAYYLVSCFEEATERQAALTVVHDLLNDEKVETGDPLVAIDSTTAVEKLKSMLRDRAAEKHKFDSCADDVGRVAEISANVRELDRRFTIKRGQFFVNGYSPDNVTSYSISTFVSYFQPGYQR